MRDADKINVFQELLPFLGIVCGSDCEIVLHDLTKPGGTVIAIQNNQTNRVEGQSLTDFAKEIQEKKLYEDQEFLANYFGHSSGKVFRSSTYFIKNDGRLIGMLCINKNLAAVHAAVSALNNMIAGFNLSVEPNHDAREDFDTNIENMMKTFISGKVHEVGITPDRMSREEKVRLVHQFNEAGILKTRGAVAEIAEQLGISEPTLYRYLKISLD